MAEGKYEIICMWCGEHKKVNDKRRQFCSLKCANAYKGFHSRKNLICKQCGEEFYKPSKDGIKFCSPECRHKWNDEIKEKKKEEKEAKWKAEHLKICVECKKEFVVKNKNCNVCPECKKVRERKRSREYSISKHKITKIKCKNCGIEIDRLYGDKHSEFCSDECCKIYQSKISKQSPHEKEKARLYSAKRKKQIKDARVDDVKYEIIFERDNGICQICGLPIPTSVDRCNRWAGTIDHKIPLSKGGLHSYENCWLSHRQCNSNKQDLTYGYLTDWKEKIKKSNHNKKIYDELISILISEGKINNELNNKPIVKKQESPLPPSVSSQLFKELTAACLRV